MGLDFTALNNIPLQNATETPTERVSYALENTKRERDNARQVYAEYQQNRKKAETLTSGILKELRAGEAPLDILLQAIECISLMTGNAVLYTQSKDTIKAVYGWGLGGKAPLRLELKEARARLEKLTRPELITPDTPKDVQEHIKTAVRAHRELIERLERDIEGASHGAD